MRDASVSHAVYIFLSTSDQPTTDIHGHRIDVELMDTYMLGLGYLHVSLCLWYSFFVVMYCTSVIPHRTHTGFVSKYNME